MTEEVDEEEGAAGPRFLTTSETVKVQDSLSTPEGRESTQRHIPISYGNNPLTLKYMHMLASDERDRLMDYTYGVRHHDGKWMTGDSQLKIEEKGNFLIKVVRYKRYARSVRTDIHEVS